MPESLKVAATSSPPMQFPQSHRRCCVWAALPPLSRALAPSARLCRAPLRAPRLCTERTEFSNPFQLYTTHTSPFQRSSTQVPRLPTQTTLIQQPEKREWVFLFSFDGFFLNSVFANSHGLNNSLFLFCCH